MKIEFGTHLNWREVGIRLAFNKWYENSFFIELNAWKWFVSLKFKSKEQTK